MVNHGGHEDADIRRITTQFMECDNVSLDEQLAKIKMSPPSNLRLSSKPGIHYTPIG